MSLIDHIEKIQKKPDHVRKQIVTATTVVTTGIIVLVWLVAANPLSLNNKKTNKDSGYGPAAMLKDIKDMAGVAGAAMGGVKEDVNQIKGYSDLLKQQIEKQNQLNAITNMEEATTTAATTTSYDNLDLNN